MQKIRVGIVFGGQSAEHEVSLQSALNIFEAIDRTRFDPVLLGVDKLGCWHVLDSHNFLLNANDPCHITMNLADNFVAITTGKEGHQLTNIQKGGAIDQIDVVFPIIHGSLGEDGCLQGLLRMANLPFVGSDVLGSAVCMDKDICKKLLRDAGLPITPFVTVTQKNKNDEQIKQQIHALGFPLFIKPANQGSSVGVSKVKVIEQYEQALENAFKFDRKVIIEQGIVGREIECAVLGNASPSASECGEVILHSEFYSYESKYVSATDAHVEVPAQMDPEVKQHIQHLAVKAFTTLECSGLARVDFFLKNDNQVLINEINTLPGFTNISMYPKLWESSGLAYGDLITRLIELAIERFDEQHQYKHSLT